MEYHIAIRGKYLQEKLKPLHLQDIFDPDTKKELQQLFDRRAKARETTFGPKMCNPVVFTPKA